MKHHKYFKYQPLRYIDLNDDKIGYVANSDYTLMDEANKIMKAQTARGADFESGNLIQKAKAMVPLLVPLFVSAFRRAEDLAMAMEARCYNGGEGRTKMKPLKYQKHDYQSYAIVIVFLVAVIVAANVLPFPQ